MQIYIDDRQLDYKPEQLDKTDLFQRVREELDREIIDKIYIDEREVSIDYFKENELELDELESISFVTKRVEELIKETLLQAEDYVPRLKQALQKAAALYRRKEISEASKLMQQSLTGVEWYIEVMDRILNLIEDRQAAEEGRELLEQFNQAMTAALETMNNEDYVDLADTLESRVIHSLDKLLAYQVPPGL